MAKLQMALTAGLQGYWFNAMEGMVTSQKLWCKHVAGPSAFFGVCETP